MNKRIIVFLLGVALLLITWWLIKHWRGYSTKDLAGPTVQNFASNSVSAAPSQSQTGSGSTAPSPTIQSGLEKLEHNPKVIAMENAVAAENAKTINVYGKVIDQFGQPVVNATVKGSALLLKGWDQSGSTGVSTTTDAEGYFNFTGLHGYRFGLGIEKPGYKYDPERFIGWWDKYKPDPSNPVIFHMWKLQGAEPMIHAKFGAWIPYDGTPVRIDLFTGKKNESGDLQISLIRHPLQVRRGVDHFDWEAQIQVMGGGLVESNGPYPYEAPEGGYQPSYGFGQAKDAENWTRKLQQTFYVRTAKGEYVRLPRFSGHAG